MNAINWLVEKSATEISGPDFFEGTGMVTTTSGFFNGTIPSRMRSELYSFLKSINAKSRNTTYSWSDGNNDYSITFGQYKSTQNTIRFSFNSYEIKEA